MIAWLSINASWVMPCLLAMATASFGWLVRRLEQVLTQVRKINGSVAKHDQWINHFEKMTETRRSEISLRIGALEDRERDRLQAEVVEARGRKAKRVR